MDIGRCRNIKIEIPEKANYIIKRIAEAGYEAYVVGGCVRDSILGRKPEDWDITTSASPDQVKKLFSRTIDTGIAHGTVTVMMDKEGFEVTTYRIDGKYEDSRHPKEVTFTPNLEEDLKRRDFTINAMAYNDQSGLVDIFGGMEDINKKVIRCVGKAEERFTEDALRIMRAIRFSAQLGYDIECNTRKAISILAPRLENISAERVQVELVKLLTSPHPDTLRIAYELGVTAVILPEFDEIMKTFRKDCSEALSVGEHTLQSLQYTDAKKELRLAMLFHEMAGGDHGISEEMAKQILKRLRFDNDTIYYVTRLVRYHDDIGLEEPDMRMVRREINRVGEDIMPLLFPVRKADILSQDDVLREEKLRILEHWQELYHKVIQQEQCVSLKTLAVTGSDLIAAGMKPGKELGQVLQKLLEMVLDEPDLNSKEELLQRAFLIK